MPRATQKAALERVQHVMVSMAARHRRTRRVMAGAGRLLSDAAERGSALAEARAAGVADTYDGSYFGEGRDASGDRAGRSGYARYDRIASNADIAGWLLWRNFRVGNALDVGLCHRFPRRGPPRARRRRRRLRPEPLRRRPRHARRRRATSGWRASSPGCPGRTATSSWSPCSRHSSTSRPTSVPIALRELRRVCGGYLYATIPSFGGNVSGPDGHFEGKVRPERVVEYVARGPDYAGPVPERGPGGRCRRAARSRVT